MSRLRHPIRSIREPFGKAGLTVAVIALVFAMVGGAFAAVGLNGKQKKEVEKIAKKFAGKPGAQGPQGPAGSNGTNGTNGKDGSNGAPGADGKSVVVTEIEAGEEGCEERGGAEVKQEGAGSAIEVCNGTQGSPWTAGGTLPPGQTETGSWAVGETTTFPFNINVPLSFTIPLPGPLDASHVHYINAAGKEVLSGGEEVTSTACLGEASEPSAKPGHLCVYSGREFFVTMKNSLILDPAPGGSDKAGASVAGAFMRIHRTEEEGQGYGTFAVTAATE
jgi:hypothetical protein